MRKLILLTLSCAISFFGLAQDLLFSRAEVITTDDRKVRGLIIATTKSWIADLNVNSDDPDSYTFSIGPNFARRRDREIRIGPMLGLNITDGELFYVGRLFFKATELRNFEVYTYIQIMTGFNAPVAKASGDGEIMYRVNKNLQVGAHARAEVKKWKSATPYGPDGLMYDDHFYFMGQLVWAPKGWNNFSVIGSAGWLYRCQASKTLVAGLVLDTSPKNGVTNNLNATIGLQYRLKYRY